MNRMKKRHILAAGLAALLTLAGTTAAYADSTISGAPGGGAIAAPAIYVPAVSQGASGNQGSSGAVSGGSTAAELKPSSQSGPGMAAKLNQPQTAQEASQDAQVQAPVYTGWQKHGENYVWYQEDGTLLVNAWTPDGYFVDEGGTWKTETRNFLDETFAVTDRFRTAQDMPSMGALLSDLNRLNKRVQAYMDGKRIFHAYNEYVTYSKLDNKNETLLMSLNRDKDRDGWNIQLACDLGTRNNNRNYATTVDYEVLHFFISQISHTPNQVIDAIYRSWQGDNAWGLSFTKEVPVGDSMITYGADDGVVGYSIRRRP